ncbi:hypothetical protein K7711_09980 [Nocardia sp. CA2R105]|uniref:hypothetical protein n=1 Tax=Nocardia coffeae TaxID=2873381 RepID=UPI001CA6A6D9|nr:hypothetical protein [Nocardia coffeae]MBY8856804.1 hypothetical protein [Nocardia coffeae]
MAVTLCVAPRKGELCAPIRFTLSSDQTFLELTARHLIRKVELGSDDEVVVFVDITDPETSRPVHVRFDLIDAGGALGSRGVLVGTIERGGRRLDVVGTYLGVVSEEN